MRSHVAPLVVGAALALGPAVAAQSFSESITVVEVEIPVQVLRNGDPVDDLGRNDFEVRIDGEPTDLAGFQVLRRDTTGRRPEARSGARVRDDTVSRPRHVLVLFDLLFAERHRIVRAVDGVRTMVDTQLASDDRVALAIFSGTGARLLVGFTRDREEIDLGLDLVRAMLAADRRSLEKIETRLRSHAREERAAAPLEFLTERIGPTAAIGFGFGLESTVDTEGLALVRAGKSGNSRARDVNLAGRDPTLHQIIAENPEAIGESLADTSSLSAIRTLTGEIDRLATFLRDVPGPKDLLYLSEGFRSAILEDPTSPDRAQALGYLHDMLEALIRGGWTLHGIDIEGIPGLDAPAFDAHALFYMANETGGTTQENFNRIGEATERFLYETSTTYLLTVRAEDIPTNGDRHEIQVRLRDGIAGARVVHRPAFYAPRPDSELDGLELEMNLVEQLLGDEEKNPLATEAIAGRVPAVAQGSGGLRFAIAIPAQTLSTDGPARKLPLEIRVFALRDDGAALAGWSRRLSLDLDKVGDRIDSGGLRVLGVLPTSTPADRLRLLVRVPGQPDLTLLTVPVDATWHNPDWPWKRGLNLSAN